MVATSASSPKPASDGSAYSYFVVAALATIYMLNFLDRQLLSVLAEMVKADLRLSDTELGMLTGLAFALFYTVFGIPVAALADRFNRVRIVSIACGMWSLFSAASGFATGFVTLALARIGVGIGEAGGSPPSYSILADYFPPERRGSALALYSLGVPLGSLVGISAGGWIAANYGWRAAFVTVGIFGLVLAPILCRVVREPPRGRFDATVGAADDAQHSASMRAALRYFARSPVLVLNALAAGLTGFVSYGILNWAPAYLQRGQGMSMSQVASTYSVVVSLSMAFGIWFGGMIVDRVGKRVPGIQALVPGFAMLVMIPFLFAATGAKGWEASLAFLVAPLMLGVVYLAPALAIVQDQTPPRYRATGSAILLFSINLIGLGGGPLFVGSISDRLQPALGAAALGHALRWLTPFMILTFACQCASAWYLRRAIVRDRQRMTQNHLALTTTDR